MNWQEGLRHKRGTLNTNKWEEKNQEMQVVDIRKIYMISNVQRHLIEVPHKNNEQ